MLIIGLIHVSTGRNFTILLRVVSRVHHMNTGILSDFHECDDQPSEYILQYLRIEVFGFYYTSRQKRNQMYLIIGIKHRIIQCPSEKYTICAKDLLILDLYTFRFGRGISYSI